MSTGTGLSGFLSTFGGAYLQEDGVGGGGAYLLMISSVSCKLSLSGWEGGLSAGELV